MDSLLLAILIPALFIASFCDFYWHLIPNFITLPLIVAGLAINFMVFGVDGFFNAAKGMGIGFGIFIIFYLFGAMGAGDVKLVAGIGALVGGDKIALVLFFYCIHRRLYGDPAIGDYNVAEICVAVISPTA